MKAIVRVLEAVSKGCETSGEVEAFTQIPRAECSHWLTELRLAGLIKQTHRPSRNSGRFARYQVVK